MEETSGISFTLSEKILLGAGVLMLASGGILVFSPEFSIWATAKAVYAVGVILYLLDK